MVVSNMTLSLSMIVKNEEETLSKCLESVKSLVDEMVILDTGSTDCTPEVARSFGAKVSFFDWNHDFSAARNACLRNVTGDWVLVLDADEVLVPEVVPLIRQAIQDDRHLVINLLRQEVGADQSPYSLLSRLFRCHPEVCFSRPYHELVDDSVAQLLQREPHWQIVEIPQVALLHEGYKPETIAARNKTARARLAMEGFLATHPTDPYLCSKLGALYLQEGELDQGLALLKRGLQAKPTEVPILFELHFHLGIAYSKLHHADLAKAHYRAALKQPLLPALKLGAAFNLASLLQQQGNLTEAEKQYREILQIDPTFAIAHCELGRVLRVKNRFREAIDHYQQSIHHNPQSPEAHQNLGTVLLQIGQLVDSREAFRQAILLYEQQQSPEADRLRQGLAEMGIII
ncbi:MAG: tetratricopeptide repeat protein [Leptolyngbyaceae cyanobacterium bins.59]|nr:tetratricopeptide repeat protein [Leptolyngbyaceae cyanobacterium bins.59]